MAKTVRNAVREIARQAGAMGAQDIVRWASAQVGR